MSIAIASIPAYPIQPSSAPPAPPPPAEQREESVSQPGPRRAAIDTSVRPLVDVSGLTTAQEAAPPAAAKTQQTQTTIKSGEDCGDCDDKAPGELSEEEKAVVAKLKATDQQVRAHEQAHAAAGGGYAGSPSFSYQTGPDGKRYAVAGHVPIDVSPVNGDPQATIQKMDTVLRAALAPSDPSGADRAVAATAAKQKAEAQTEAAKERQQALQEALGGPDTGDKAGDAGTSKPVETLDIGALAGGATAAPDAGKADSGNGINLSQSDTAESGFRPFVPASNFGDQDGGKDTPFDRQNQPSHAVPAFNTGHDDTAASPFDTFADLKPDHSQAAFARATSAYEAHNIRDAADQPGIL
jgi:hypothetical protein